MKVPLFAYYTATTDSDLMEAAADTALSGIGHHSFWQWCVSQNDGA